MRKEPWWIQYKHVLLRKKEKKVYSDYRKHRWDIGDKILMFYQYFDNIKFVMFNSHEYESYYAGHV